MGVRLFFVAVTRGLRGLLRAPPAKHKTEDTAKADGPAEARHTPEAGAVLMVLVGMQLVYYVSYGSDFLQFAFFGMALAWVAGQPKPLSSTPTPLRRPTQAMRGSA